MASCSTYALNGLAKSCCPNKGGIKEVYIAPFDSVTGLTENSGETITAITGTSAMTWHVYSLRKGTASMTSTLNVDDANGINYVETTLNLTFPRMDAAKRMEMKALALNELAVIVKDENGKLWYLGKDNPVVATGGDSASGQAIGDGNSYGITLTTQSDTYPQTVDESAFNKTSAVEADC